MRPQNFETKKSLLLLYSLFLRFEYLLKLNFLDHTFTL